MIRFDVAGEPAAKGSYRAIPTRAKTKQGRQLAIVKNDDPRCTSWQELVGWSAKAAMRGAPPMKGAVTIEAVFRFPRPPTTKLAAPRLDVDKLARALLDGLTGIVYVDDKQVARLHARKEWGPAGVSVVAVETPVLAVEPPPTAPPDSPAYAPPHPTYLHRCSACSLVYAAVSAAKFADGGWPPLHWLEDLIEPWPLCPGFGKPGTRLDNEGATP